MNCPVCDKSGLPDYKSNPITCPQCNSDLSGFAIIEKGSYKFQQILNRQKWLYAIIIVLMALSGISFNYKPGNNQKNAEIQLKDSTIALLNSELQNKELEIQELKASAKTDQVIEFKYVVKKGDNLSKIANIFYNDWRLYEKIQEDNDLEPHEIIMPKDTLIIKIKTDPWKY